MRIVELSVFRNVKIHWISTQTIWINFLAMDLFPSLIHVIKVYINVFYVFWNEALTQIIYNS